MTIEVTTRLDGTAAVRGNLRRMPRAMRRRVMSPATKSVAEVAAGFARRSRAYRNFRRRLRPSTRVEQIRDRGGRLRTGWAVVFGGRLAPHAPHIEYGTRYILARYVIRNALRRVRTVALRRMTAEARRRLPGAVRSVRRGGLR